MRVGGPGVGGFAAEIGTSGGGETRLVKASRSVMSSRAPAPRALGDFSSRRATTLSNPRGIDGFRRLGGIGVVPRIAANTSAVETPGNARQPVAISWRVAPREKRSLDGAAGNPCACSGD